MTVETEDDVAALKRIGKIVSYALQEMLGAAEPGMTTRELDSIGEELLEGHGAIGTKTHLQLSGLNLYQYQRRGCAWHSG
jgi:methionine aminopeptidase